MRRKFEKSENFDNKKKPGGCSHPDVTLAKRKLPR